MTPTRQRSPFAAIKPSAAEEFFPHSLRAASRVPPLANSTTFGISAATFPISSIMVV